MSHLYVSHTLYASHTFRCKCVRLVLIPVRTSLFTIRGGFRQLRSNSCESTPVTSLLRRLTKDLRLSFSISFRIPDDSSPGSQGST